MNLTLEEGVIDVAKRLAKADNRSISNWFETLVLREKNAQAGAKLPRSARLSLKRKKAGAQ